MGKMDPDVVISKQNNKTITVHLQNKFVARFRTMSIEFVNGARADDVPEVQELNKKIRDTQTPKPKPRDGFYGSHKWITYFIVLNHILAVYALLFHFHVPAQLYVWCFALGYTMLVGITAGYHRLWSHRAYDARLPLRIFLSIIGAIAFQDNDPYNSKKGLWYTHIGWLFETPRLYSKTHLIDMKDLDADPVPRLQAKLLILPYLFLGLLMPPFVGYLYGDTIGGLLWVGVMARLVGWHGIWSINSLAHWYGARPYQMRSSAASSYLVALISAGEGNHSFHHEFPQDYRHGFSFVMRTFHATSYIKWHEIDLSKWLIYLWSLMGLAYNLRRTDDKVIHATELQQKTLAILEERKKVKWPSIQELPQMSVEEMRSRLKNEPKLFLLKIGNLIVDVTDFKEKHPGGEKLLKAYRGLDATDAFESMNMHTDSAKHILALHAIGRCDAQNAGN